MNRRERARLVKTTLAELYPHPPIPLDHGSPFTLLVAVLLSAQCTDLRVNKVTPKLFELADTPEAMADLSADMVLPIIRSCGLGPQKSRAIVALSAILVAQHGGRVPEDLQALEQLPGVGHKTASVVMCQAFGQAAFPVDTHIHRLAKRWGLSSGKNVVTTERDLKRLFPQQSWAELHLQMIYYGREHCTARGCDGRHCMICSALQQRPARAAP